MTQSPKEKSNVVNESEKAESAPRQMSLLRAIVDMVAVAEGGIVNPKDPEFTFSANNALYGININNESRLVYDKDNGLELVPMQK